MILGVGIDIVDIERMERILARRGERFVRRVFTPSEERYCSAARRPALHFAARFAAKESLLKSLGRGLGAGGFREIEVVREKGGRPAIRLSGKIRDVAAAAGVEVFHLSLSHTDTSAVAMVIAEGGGGES